MLHPPKKGLLLLGPLPAYLFPFLFVNKSQKTPLSKTVTHTNEVDTSQVDHPCLFKAGLQSSRLTQGSRACPECTQNCQEDLPMALSASRGTRCETERHDKGKALSSSSYLAGAPHEKRLMRKGGQAAHV